MSGYLLALILGPIAGLVLEAVGLWGTTRKAADAGGGALRLVQLIERVKGKLDAAEQKEANEAIQDAQAER